MSADRVINVVKANRLLMNVGVEPLNVYDVLSIEDILDYFDLINSNIDISKDVLCFIETTKIANDGQLIQFDKNKNDWIETGRYV